MGKKKKGRKALTKLLFSIGSVLSGLGMLIKAIADILQD